MNSLNEFINHFTDYVGIFILMLSTFLIGYFSALLFTKSQKRRLISRLKNEVNSLKTQTKNIRDIDIIFNEIKPKIVAVVKETQKELTSSPSPEKIAKKARSSYVTYSKNKPKLNFENIGQATIDEKDDLTQINGIGPYIEEKLNEIEIFTFDQISKFTLADIRVVTELIDFFPERIERDEWIEQAQGLKIY